MTTVGQLLKESLKKLKKTSDTPQLDAEILLSFVLKKSREFILTYPRHKLTNKKSNAFNNSVKKRLHHKPIAYITGQKEFYGLPFKVTKDTLIPRPETEILVEETLSLLRNMLHNKKNIKTNIIDIGTGSGNIIISLAKNLNNLCHSRENGNPASNLKISTLNSRRSLYSQSGYGNNNLNLLATDISPKALSIAKYNAKKNKVASKIKFLESDLLNYFIKNNLTIRQSDNLILVANLPYLSEKIYSSCKPNVKKFEPKYALLSGIDGLDHYKKLFKQIKKILPTKYQTLHTILEINPEQKQKIKKLIKNYFSSADITFQKDLARKWRVVSFKI